MIRSFMFSVAILACTCSMSGQASAVHRHRSNCGSPAYRAPVRSRFLVPSYSSFHHSPRVGVGIGGYSGYGYGPYGYGGYGGSYYGYPGLGSRGLSIGIGTGLGYGSGYGVGW